MVIFENISFMNYKISDITKREFPEVMQLWEASVRATHHFVTEEDIIFFKELIPQYLDAVHLFAVRNADDKIIGFLGILHQCIEMLFIHPDMRRCGIGKFLLEFAINQLQLCKVDVNEQNSEAVEFYCYMGFSTVGRSELDGSGKPYPILHLEYKKLI